MEVRLKLMGVLKERTPTGGALQLREGATILDALRSLEIPPESVQVFMVNGQLERSQNRSLAPDDELSILPPVGGG